MLSLKFFISNGLLPVCSFFLPIRSVVVQLLKIFGNKKRLQLSILNDTILQPGVLFYQTQTLILAISARRHVVRNKVPWLCVTASRRFCRQVFIFLKQNLQTVCSAFSPLVLRLYTPQNFLSSIFKHFSQFVYKFKPCFSQKTPKSVMKTAWSTYIF